MDPTEGRRFAGWSRRALLLLPAAVGVSLVQFARSRPAPAANLVASVRDAWQYQDAALLARAWSMPVALRMRPVFVSQRNGSTCGPSTLANVFRSFGQNSDEASVLVGTGESGAGVCPGGLTLDELAGVAGKNPAHRVTVLRDLRFEQFREHLRRSNDPVRRYTINFQRAPLFGEGGGHHSPIGGYLEREDLVFVLDTNDRFRPFLVDARRLFDAMNTVDSSAGKKRGLLVIELGG